MKTLLTALALAADLAVQSPDQVLIPEPEQMPEWREQGRVRFNQPDGTGGSPPLRNACRQPGEWQSLQIWFQTPRFDSGGKKTTNARVLRILLNEVLIQDSVELGGPTGSHLNVPEAPANPLMLQGDHGPIAFRNIYIRPLSSGASKYFTWTGRFNVFVDV